MMLRLETDGHLSNAQIAEKSGNYQESLFFYAEAIYNLLSILKTCSDDQCVVELTKEIEHWLDVAETVKAKVKDKKSSLHFETNFPGEMHDFEMAKFIFKQAMDADENGWLQKAIDRYISVAEVCIRLSKSPNISADERKTRKQYAEKATERGEQLKTKLKNIARKVGNCKGGSFSKKEIQVLYETSVLNNVQYLPYLPVDDQKEQFAYQTQYNDSDIPEGVLGLSQEQISIFHKWMRISELSDKPQIMGTLSPIAVRQTLVSDCSVIASLIVAADWERKYFRPLISSHIFPKDSRTGKPVYNPCGKYMIKLHLNGIWRKIIIDDKLPVSQDNDLLCSYSQNPNEFWVSLLEKAYLKAMGGYDFPGSNSAVDLNALTGWIPERINLCSNKASNQNDQFVRILNSFDRGDCLITVSTAKMKECEEKETGLVSSHAYAVLDIKDIDGLQMMLIKNPWSHNGWKGKYSANDEKNWTPSLKVKLGYDPRNARLLDNGIFWMEYTDVCHFFDVINLNWNPEMFPYRDVLHKTWLVNDGPKKDTYDVSGNPQFKLFVKSHQQTMVWVVLTRHITTRDDFGDIKEYITLIVYKDGGRRVYSPAEPFIDGVRKNSPHYLAKIDDDGNDNIYTLLVSQFEKSNTLHFTLNAYASCPIEMTEIVDQYSYKYTITGEWDGQTAGGCSNHSNSFMNNPVFLLAVEKFCDLAIILKAPRSFSIGFYLFKQQNEDPFWELPFCDTGGPFQFGFLAKEFSSFEPGPYFLVPTTFLPNQEGPFIFEIRSSAPFSINPKS